MVLSKSHSPIAFDELLDLQVLVSIELAIREKCLAFGPLLASRWSIFYNNLRFLVGINKYPGSLKLARGKYLSLLQVFFHKRLSERLMNSASLHGFSYTCLYWYITSFHTLIYIIETHQLANEANIWINLRSFPPDMI